MKNQDYKTPYTIVHSRYLTEKTTVLESLKDSESNRCTRLCDTPKYVFLVDLKANKQQIAAAVEEIYSEKKVKVLAVNTMIVKPKPKRKRGRAGLTKKYKKAIVTFEKGDVIDDV